MSDSLDLSRFTVAPDEIIEHESHTHYTWTPQSVKPENFDEKNPDVVKRVGDMLDEIDKIEIDAVTSRVPLFDRLLSRVTINGIEMDPGRMLGMVFAMAIGLKELRPDLFEVLAIQYPEIANHVADVTLDADDECGLNVHDELVIARVFRAPKINFNLLGVIHGLPLQPELQTFYPESLMFAIKAMMSAFSMVHAVNNSGKLPDWVEAGVEPGAHDSDDTA